MKVVAKSDRTHKPFGEIYWVSRLRENLTSGSNGEGLETGLRSTLNGHAGGNPGYSQGHSYGLPRQSFTRQTLFACLKTRGFRLESTHLRDLQRISKLFALLAVAFCWCYRIGIWLNEQKSIRICTHQRLAHSLFRHGLDHLRHICLNAHHRKNEFMHMLRLLSCT